MRESGEITADEFKARRAKYKSELTAIDTKTVREHAERKLRRDEASTAIRASVSLLRDFLTGSASERKAIARQVASRYVLTQGRLQIVPNKIFDQIRAFEPPKTGSQNKKDGPGGAVPFAWRCFLDSVRTFVNWSDDLK